VSEDFVIRVMEAVLASNSTSTHVVLLAMRTSEPAPGAIFKAHGDEWECVICGVSVDGGLGYSNRIYEHRMQHIREIEDVLKGMT